MLKSKDFTDWGGRKRHDTLFPPRERTVRGFTVKKKDKPAGLKTKADRYKALLADLKTYWGWRRREQRERREEKNTTRENKNPHIGSRWWPHWEETVKEKIKALKKLKAQYKKEGVWERLKI